MRIRPLILYAVIVILVVSLCVVWRHHERRERAMIQRLVDQVTVSSANLGYDYAILGIPRDQMNLDLSVAAKRPTNAPHERRREQPEATNGK